MKVVLGHPNNMLLGVCWRCSFSLLQIAVWQMPCRASPASTDALGLHVSHVGSVVEPPTCRDLLANYFTKICRNLKNKVLKKSTVNVFYINNWIFGARIKVAKYSSKDQGLRGFSWNTVHTETHIRAHQLRFSLHVYFLLRKLFTLDRKSPYVEKNNNT